MPLGARAGRVKRVKTHALSYGIGVGRCHPPGYLRPRMRALPQGGVQSQRCYSDDPGKPCSPWGPAGPCAPVALRSPFGPCGPGGLLGPVAPGAPVSPLFPLGPAAPVVPCGPRGPTLPSTLEMKSLFKRSAALTSSTRASYSGSPRSEAAGSRPRFHWPVPQHSDLSRLRPLG